MSIINNRDVLQSYVLTTAKYDFSVYEKRFLYRLVELAQCEVEGLDFRRDCRKIEHDLFGLVTVTLPIASMLNGEDDKNYLRVKNALLSLQKKIIIYEDNDVWQSISIIAFPDIRKGASTVSCTLHPKIWDCILNFSKGYRKFELETAMTFESVYSMRFYEMISGQKEPFDRSIEKLKEMFKLENKYKLTADFTRYVLDKAKKELDAKSPYTFTYSVIKEGRKYSSIRFFPVYQPQHRDDKLERIDLQKRVALSWDLSKNVINYLKHGFEFNTKEIKQHIDLFKKAEQEIDFIQFMSMIKPKANRANNPKGYLINAIKKELKINL